jgi:hypothetical protein
MNMKQAFAGAVLFLGLAAGAAGAQESAPLTLTLQNLISQPGQGMPDANFAFEADNQALRHEVEQQIEANWQKATRELNHHGKAHLAAGNATPIQ